MISLTELQRRKLLGLSDAFSVQQVPALVLRQDLQPRSHGETNNWSEGIFESDAIDVVVSGAMNELTCLMVAAEEPIENGRIDLCARPDLPGCAGSSRFGRGFDVVANEPAAEPARLDVLNPRELSTHQRIRDRLQVFPVGEVQVFEALANAPHARSRSPVELPRSKRFRERGRALVGGIELGNQTDAPCRDASSGLV